MPLARAAMHNLGEAVHVAAWPTVREEYAIASRHYAMEGRCFVLAAGLVQTKDDLFDGLERVGGNSDALELINAIEGQQLNRGGSMIIAPDARVMTQAGEGEEILHADIDLTEIGNGLASLDSDGHYSRPDVFELNVDTRAKDGVKWNSN
jgi:predicted amidohydrolase